MDLNGIAVENLTKMNEKVRGMIRRFNDDLNDILTKNTILLKAKSNETNNDKGVEGRLAVLAEEKKNNQKTIERMEEELNKLRHR